VAKRFMGIVWIRSIPGRIKTGDLSGSSGASA
jgi:hypothetical protein